jgi:hypothetical protein
MAAGFVWSSLNTLFAPVALLVADVDWKWLPRSGWTKTLFSVLRGLFVAVPILFVFGALFMAADAVYEGMVRNIFNVDLEVPFTHVLLTCIFAWLTAGYFRGVLIDRKASADVKDPANRGAVSGLRLVEHFRTEDVANPKALPDHKSAFEHLSQEEERSGEQAPQPDVKKPWQWQNIDNSLLPPAFTLGAVEIGIILGLVDLLFLSFVIVQVPYLFGGMDLVQTTPDFSLAEYARRGFGELVAASALVMPLLLVSHWLLRRENPLIEKLFRWLASIQIVLVFIIMASAGQRLFLLTGDLGYGLTVVRLYSMIFMTWLAIIFAWFALTVIRGRRQYFAWGALWAAFLVLGTTHVLNPDDFVVRTNLSLLQQGRPFDPKYVVRLSDDAVPALIESIPFLDPGQQCIVRSKLSRRSIYAAAESDIRTWNLSRWNARVQLQAAGDSLDLDGCPEMKPWSGPKEDV